MRILMLAIAGLAALLVLSSLLIDEGSLVTLVTSDGEREHDTQLWIVDVGGAEYLRAASPDVHWLARLRARPEAELRRGRDRKAPLEKVRAEPSQDDALRARVNRAMARKYGLADRLWSWLSDRRRSVPIRLRPRVADPGGDAADAASWSPPAPGGLRSGGPSSREESP